MAEVEVFGERLHASLPDEAPAGAAEPERLLVLGQQRVVELLAAARKRAA